MTTKGRILAIRLVEKIKDNQEYAKKLCIGAEIKLLPTNVKLTDLISKNNNE